MGSGSSVSSVKHTVYIEAALNEFESCRAVMTRKAARNHMLEYLTSGAFPFTEEVCNDIKSIYSDVCMRIDNATKMFHEKWNEIVDGDGQKFKESRKAIHFDQSPLFLPGMGMGMLSASPGDEGMEANADPTPIHETETDNQQEEFEAKIHIVKLFDNLRFENKLPDYIYNKLNLDAIIPIKLNMRERKNLMDTYLSEEAELFRLCDEIELEAQAAAMEHIHKVQSLPKDKVTIPSNMVWGVSLRFLLDFLELHKDVIEDTTTTGTVVHDIIIPETKQSKQSYVNACILKKNPHYLSDLRKGFRRSTRLSALIQRGTCPENCGLFTFLSHAWLMPFRKLIEIASVAARTFTGTSQGVKSTKYLDACFFWIDVFCKKQHTPAPAMKEFRDSIAGPGRCIIAMYPLKAIAVSRIWCIYEAWTASLLGDVEIFPFYPETEFNELIKDAKTDLDQKLDDTEMFRKFCYFVKSILKIDVTKATATRPDDISMIMDMIETTMGIDVLNNNIETVLINSLWKRFTSLYDVHYTNKPGPSSG